MTQYFKVVGGECRGGILVRSRKSTLSQQLAERLATGAVVEELQSDGHRLQFSKVSGEGPREGWVTIEMPNTKKILLIPCAAPRPLQEEDVSSCLQTVSSASSPTPLPAGSPAPATVPAPQPMLTACAGMSLCSLPSFSHDFASSSSQPVPAESAPTPLAAAASSPPALAASPAVSRGSGCTPACGVVNLNTDLCGVVRGHCQSCENCETWQLQGHAAIPWRSPNIGGSSGSDNGSELPTGVCSSCGCPAEQHCDLSQWHERVRRSLLHFRDPVATNRLLPSSTFVPARVRQEAWSESEVALHVLTAGRFDPGAGSGRRRSPDLVSVCVPTSTRRHHFHELLYENFRQQTYQPKELVVVDTGAKPSAFMQKMAKTDTSLVYHHYPVSDSKYDRMQAFSRLRNTNFARFSPTPPKYEPQPNSWSLGLKRNVAAALAAGRYIAHFDDDDLYSPDYLQYMVRQLEKQVEKHTVKSCDEASRAVGCNSEEEADEDGAPALVTLREWHLFDFTAQKFRHMDPSTDPDVLPAWRKPMMMGYGFSYVYTRAAWKLQAFPDREDCEDDIFVANLEKKRAEAVGLIPLPSKDVGLVAHSFHADNTGMLEFNGNKRLGKLVSRPIAFDRLMPIVQSIKLPIQPQQELSRFISQSMMWQGYRSSALTQQARGLISGKGSSLLGAQKHPWQRGPQMQRKERSSLSFQVAQRTRS